MKKKIMVCILSAFIFLSSSLSSFALVPQAALLSTIYAIGKVVCTSVKVVIDAEGVLSLGYQVYNTLTPQQQDDLKKEDLYNKNGEYVISDDFYNKVSEYTQGKTITMNNNIILDLPVIVDYYPNQPIKVDKAHSWQYVQETFDTIVRDNPFYRTTIHSQGIKIDYYSAPFYVTDPDSVVFYGYFKINGVDTAVQSYSWCKFTDDMYIKYQFNKLKKGIYFNLNVFNSKDEIVHICDTYNAGPYFGVAGGVNSSFDCNLVNKESLTPNFTYTELENIKDVYPSLQLRPKEELDKTEEEDNNNSPDNNSPDNNGPDNNGPIINNPPSFPDLQEFDFSGLQLDPLTNLFSNFKNKFPFSLPFDLANLISGLTQDPIPPIFEADLFGETMTLDLTQFTELANILKMFTILAYLVSLILITKKFGG